MLVDGPQVQMRLPGRWHLQGLDIFEGHGRVLCLWPGLVRKPGLPRRTEFHVPRRVGDYGSKLSAFSHSLLDKKLKHYLNPMVGVTEIGPLVTETGACGNRSAQ